MKESTLMNLMKKNMMNSSVKKLLQAAALAAVLIPLGTVAVETSSITCGFGAYTGCEGEGAGGNDNIFDFGSYLVDLTFLTPVTGNFFVTIDDVALNQAALAGRLTNFPGYVCVGIDPVSIPGDPCREFEVNAPAPGSSTWTGFYDLTIDWDFDTNSGFPNSPGNRIRILHNRGDVAGNGFDTDITIPGSYNNGDTDPGISGQDNNFQSFLAAEAPVPEPVTMLLVGSGVSALLYQRRRRRSASAESSRS